MKIVKLTYIGRREDAKGRVHYVFSDGEEERWYSRITGVWIGGIYEAERQGKSVRINRRRPRRIDTYKDERLLQKWEGADAQVEASLAKRRAEAKAKRNPKWKEVAKQLAPILGNLDIWEESTMIRLIIDEARKFRKRETNRK